MSESEAITTHRLDILPLQVGDARFIYELVNTPNWLMYIGDKHIYTLEQALDYIQVILHSNHLFFWCVLDKVTHNKMGLISLIKRDNLDYYDIGFAFLPEYCDKGYAFEAGLAFIAQLATSHSCIYALTDARNPNAIKLLNRLNFTSKTVKQENDQLLLLFERNLHK
ncbi:GNAT family N-acetyltransferase [Myroides sp. LJL115]